MKTEFAGGVTNGSSACVAGGDDRPGGMRDADGSAGRSCAAWPKRRRCRGRAGAQGRRSAPSASTRRAWTRRSSPGDDFYEFANGTWAKNTPIPADKSNYGMFTMLEDLASSARERSSRKRPRTIRAARSASPTRASSTRRRSRRKGLAPIEPWLNEIRGARQQGRLCGACRARPRASASAARSAAASARTTSSQTYIARPGPGRPRHARPRLLSVNEAKLVDIARPISRPSDQRC